MRKIKFGIFLFFGKDLMEEPLECKIKLFLLKLDETKEIGLEMTSYNQISVSLNIQILDML